MIAQEVAKKYARALLLSVKEKNLLASTAEQFVALKPVIEKDENFLNYLTAPHIPEEQHIGMIRKVFTGRIEPLYVEFLLVLLDKHRINFLPEIITEFDRLVKAEQGILLATAITAVPITGDERVKLIAKLAAKSKMKIELEEKVDRAIIGGMIVILHNEIIDGSIRHKLQTARETLADVRVH